MLCSLRRPGTVGKVPCDTRRMAVVPCTSSTHVLVPRTFLLPLGVEGGRDVGRHYSMDIHWT